MLFTVNLLKLLIYISNAKHSSSEYDLYWEEIVTEKNFFHCINLNNGDWIGGADEFTQLISCWWIVMNALSAASNLCGFVISRSNMMWFLQFDVLPLDSGQRFLIFPKVKLLCIQDGLWSFFLLVFLIDQYRKLGIFYSLSYRFRIFQALVFCLFDFPKVPQFPWWLIDVIFFEHFF